jgi:hypothetical protein
MREIEVADGVIPNNSQAFILIRDPKESSSSIDLYWTRNSIAVSGTFWWDKDTITGQDIIMGTIMELSEGPIAIYPVVAKELIFIDKRKALMYAKLKI